MAVSLQLYYRFNRPLLDIESHRNKQLPISAGGQYQGVPKDAIVEKYVA